MQIREIKNAFGGEGNKRPALPLIGMEERGGEMGLNMFLMTLVYICVVVCLSKRLTPSFVL